MHPTSKITHEEQRRPCPTFQTRTATSRPTSAAAAVPAFPCRLSRSASGKTSAASTSTRPIAPSSARPSIAGVTHFDLANNYGPPYGSSEEIFGSIFAKDFRPYRNELILSTKAGWDMWPGPYGMGGSRKYLLTSLNDSLTRMGIDYVDIFYHHRPDNSTPLEETMGALVTAVNQGKALYVGISSYSPESTREAAKLLAAEGVKLFIHQPSYSMLNRWIEHGLLATLDELGVGCIAFSPLAQGLLTDKYLNGVPADSRAGANTSGSFAKALLSEQSLRQRPRPQRHCQIPQPDPRPDGHRLDPARPARQPHRSSALAL